MDLPALAFTGYDANKRCARKLVLKYFKYNLRPNPNPLAAGSFWSRWFWHPARTIATKHAADSRRVNACLRRLLRRMDLISPLVHAATSTVYSTSASMHKGVKTMLRGHATGKFVLQRFAKRSMLTFCITTIYPQQMCRPKPCWLSLPAKLMSGNETHLNQEALITMSPRRCRGSWESVPLENRSVWLKMYHTRTKSTR